MSFNITTFKLEISEYGEVKRTFTDSDLDEFIDKAKDMITEHINRKGSINHEGEQIAKNITYRIFTE